MNVVVIGSGGREHALTLRISKSESLTKLFAVPGNPGTENIARNVNLNSNNKNEILNFCKENKIDLVVIGPEIPLVNGLSNYLRENGINVFGPDSEAAQIEGDKSFAKDLMQKYKIPTAAFKTFDKNQVADVKNYIKDQKFPLVIKASGLAAGKGVLICNNLQEAEIAVKEVFEDQIFGSAGDQIVIEEFMLGEEASIFAVTDGENFICLPAAQDYKRIGDNDTGKNTGGMGAYTPAPIVTKEILKEVEEKIIAPTLFALRNENKKFIGCLYAGLMLTNEGVKVVEFNCRFGDPETQAVLPLLKGDFLKLLYSASTGNLDKNAVKYNGGASVCVVAASKGYPDKYEKGFEITGLNEVDENVIVYHAGTKKVDNKIVTDGGRVLGVTSVIEKNNLKLAKEIAYKALEKIHFESIYFRKDISDKARK